MPADIVSIEKVPRSNAGKTLRNQLKCAPSPSRGDCPACSHAARRAPCHAGPYSRPSIPLGDRLEYEASKAPKALPAVNASGGSAVVQDVLALVSKVAGITTDADAPLLSAGLTSMHAMQLRAHLQESAGEGTQLPTTVVFEYPTVRAIAGFSLSHTSMHGRIKMEL